MPIFLAQLLKLNPRFQVASNLSPSSASLDILAVEFFRFRRNKLLSRSTASVAKLLPLSPLLPSFKIAVGFKGSVSTVLEFSGSREREI